MIPSITVLLTASAIAIAPADGGARTDGIRLVADLLGGDQDGYYEPPPYRRGPDPRYAEPGPPIYDEDVPPRPPARVYATPEPGYGAAPPGYWTRGEPVWDGY